MRKNSARKWLHATLDLLPVLLIPVFMIYSHRHTLTERTEVDIQYKYETNEVNTLDDLVEGNIYHVNLVLQQVTSDVFDLDIKLVNGYISGDIDTITSEESNNLYISEPISLNIYQDGGIMLYFYDEDYSYTYSIGLNSLTILGDIQLITITDLHTDILNFTKSDFNVIESVDVQDTTSNIMSVFMDNFNSTVSTYFNLGNVFNMNDVYNWFNTNIFGGHAPAVIYSVYNIIVYEFLMDMLFLLYGVFMFLIDFVESLMDRVFTKTRNGGR